MANEGNLSRRHVAIVGDVNTGKSTLFNALLGQDNSIVSESRGTTTDPVQKAMELIPFGPVVLIDTAGLDDEGQLGALRVKKTLAALRRCNAAIYAMDASGAAHEAYKIFCGLKVPHLLVLTKCDTVGGEALAALSARYPEALPVFSGDATCLIAVRRELSKLLSATASKEFPMLSDLVPENGSVLLVAPIDSAAPAGRLILPQAQAIRECLDSGIFCAAVQPAGIASALARLGRVDLVVTDSQAFAQVEALVPGDVKLTSFSMLLARQKGDFAAMLTGVRSAEYLPENGRVLVLEGCTHNRTHEDIGRVKIPAMLKKRTGKALHFDFRSGYDFPDDVSGYAMAVMCGNCMLSNAESENRGHLLAAGGVPYTNYGMLLAWGAGILNRCAAPFEGHV